MIDIRLTNKAISVPIQYNAYYKLVLLLAIIKYCARDKKASLQLIHLVFWSLRSENNYQILLDFAKKKRDTLTSWSFETGVDKVLSLSFINEYCKKEIVSKLLEIKILEKGSVVLDRVIGLELFEKDISKIRELGVISKSRLTKANKNWELI